MWRDKLTELVKEMQHPAWGISHFKRIYNLTKILEQSQEGECDDEALFAAAYLHDIEAFEPYRQKGKDHSEVAIQNLDNILNKIEFPSEKIPLVKDMIKSHMFNSKPSDQIETILFHDADTLDFMGTIGICRILSIVGIDDWTPDLKSAISVIKKFSEQLPQCLYTEEAKKMGLARKREMDVFLHNLVSQTRDLKDI